MELLKERIRREGVNMGHGILKVDSFINHQVDPALMLAVGGAVARFRPSRRQQDRHCGDQRHRAGADDGAGARHPGRLRAQDEASDDAPQHHEGQCAFAYQRGDDRADDLAGISRPARFMCWWSMIFWRVARLSARLSTWCGSPARR